jgi:hypothetical protein
MSPQPTAAAAGERTWFVHSFGSQDWLLMAISRAPVALAFGKGYDRRRMVRVSADPASTSSWSHWRLHVLRWEAPRRRCLAPPMCTLLASFFQLREFCRRSARGPDDARIYEFDSCLRGRAQRGWTASSRRRRPSGSPLYSSILVLTLHVPMLFSTAISRCLRASRRNPSRLRAGAPATWCPAGTVLVPQGAPSSTSCKAARWEIGRDCRCRGRRKIFPSLHTAVLTFL